MLAENKTRNVPVCITFPPDLLDFYNQLAKDGFSPIPDDDNIRSRNEIIIYLLRQIKDKATT